MQKISGSLIGGSIALLLWAGAAPAAQLELDEYVQRGNAARARADWESVANQFAQAINHPDLPKEGAMRSAMNLEYGRALGVICQFAEAENYLVRASEIAEKAASSQFAALYELAALSVAMKKNDVASGYFSRLLPVIERESRAKSSPLLVADAYDKFAVALAASGKNDEAEQRRREADKIRESRPKALPPGTITPYGAQCPKS